MLKRNKHENQHLQYSWNKYGENNFKFEIIDKGENYNELEKYYIRKYKSTNSRFGYNIMPGGENPPVGSHTKLSKDDILNLQNMLSNNKIPINEIYYVSENTRDFSHGMNRLHMSLDISNKC